MTARGLLEEYVPKASSCGSSIDGEITVDGCHVVEATSLRERDQRRVGEVRRKIGILFHDLADAPEVCGGASVDLDRALHPAEEVT